MKGVVDRIERAVIAAEIVDIRAPYYAPAGLSGIARHLHPVLKMFITAFITSADRPPRRFGHRGPAAQPRRARSVGSALALSSFTYNQTSHDQRCGRGTCRVYALAMRLSKTAGPLGTKAQNRKSTRRPPSNRIFLDTEQREIN